MKEPKMIKPRETSTQKRTAATETMARRDFLAQASVLGTALLAASSWAGAQGSGELGQRAAQTVPTLNGLFPLHVRGRGHPRRRKNIKDLTAQEKADFVAAILKLKVTPSPTGYGVGNWYDYFVGRHMMKTTCFSIETGQRSWGHDGPDLITFHRAFLLEFEEALAVVSGKPIGIPYWDWPDPASTAAMLADDVMGPSGAPPDYVVTSGPFRGGQWPINVLTWVALAAGQSADLVRAVGLSGPFPPIHPPSAQEVQAALRAPFYDVAPWDLTADATMSFRAAMDTDGLPNTCENGFYKEVVRALRPHAEGHAYIGGIFFQDGRLVFGHEANVSTSPNDPCFWLHHANIDRIAEMWWQAHNYQYLPISGGPRGVNIDDPVWPFAPLTHGDMALPAETFGYTYD